MRKIYANLDSDASVAKMMEYDSEFIKIEMNQDTKNNLSNLENTTLRAWLESHNIDIGSNLGENIICGVIE